MQKSTKIGFRLWLQEKWFEHQEEQLQYGQKCSYDVKEYFNRYKYWLKREFKHQTKEQ